jgi:prepilin-type N-terminal cleavage/methylation domain-containing protein
MLECFMLLNRKDGFSLLEMMIVAGMLGGLALVVVNLTKQTTKSSSKYQFDSEINLITNELNAITSNPATCLATFGANVLTPNNIKGKYYTVASGSAPATGYGNGGVQIASYTLATGATANDGILTILFNNKKIVGGTTTPRKINIYYEGPITAITSCRSLSTSTTDIWSHGALTDIYYIGKVGIGSTATVPAYDLDVVGDARVNNLLFNSDVRLKTDIHSITSALSGIDSLKGVTYFWNQVALDRGLKDEHRQIGLIAQDVEKVFPEAVKNDSDGMKSVNYPVLVAPLIEAVKELHRENSRLETENKNIKAWICQRDSSAVFCQ